MAISVIAALTDLGRNRIADMIVNGRGFQVVEFVVGGGGHDPSDPTVALSPNPAVIALPDQTFGPKVLASASLVTPFCPQYTALLDYTEANGNLSNFGLIARINYSPIPADNISVEDGGTGLVGSKFLFAIGNAPLKVKTDADQIQIQITLQT